MSDKPLDGKVAIVSGAAGIGRAIAEALAEAGAAVADLEGADVAAGGFMAAGLVARD